MLDIFPNDQTLQFLQNVTGQELLLGKVLQVLRRWPGPPLASICLGRRTLRHQGYRSVSQRKSGTLWHHLPLGRRTIEVGPAVPQIRPLLKAMD